MQPTYDKNMVIDEKISQTDVEFYDVREAPFRIYGLYEPTSQDCFKRLPDEVALNTNSGVAQVYLHTAGGRVRFATDSPYIALRATYNRVDVSPKMPMTNREGFDLYEDFPDAESVHRGTFVPPPNMKSGYESALTLSATGRSMRYFTVNFPSYNHPVTVEIGVRSGSALEEGLSYRNRRPVVYYGSSVTQGGCSSRPGTIYQNIIARATGLDYINLGFSGSCRGEDTIAQYMASMDFSVFVCDYDYNAPSVEHLKNTHCKLYQTIRATHPEAPYIIITKPIFGIQHETAVARKRVILDTYHYAKAQGDQKVYFIDGEYFFRGKFEQCCTVDNCHPNDLGFALMADKIESCLRTVMQENDILN